MNHIALYKTLNVYKDFKVEDSKEAGKPESGIERFQISLVIPITGVPFIKSSRL